MLVIAIDTSGDIGSVALSTGNGLISELIVRHKMDLLRRLMPNIDRLVSDAGKTPQDLDGVVIALGPGSFTGLRIGMAAAKSMAHVLNKPIVGISTFDMLAHGASAACPKSIATVIHARPGEVFWSMYRCDGNELVKVTDDAVTPIEELIASAKQEKSVVFCGDGAERNRKIFEDEFGTGSVLDAWYNIPRSSVLAKLGIDRLLRNDFDDTISIVPEYVQKPTPVVRIEAKEAK